MGDNLRRVAVVGAQGTGKSSVIKRIVSHRFDNLPTRNAEFMGARSSGRYVACLTMPPLFTSKAKAGPRQFLLEMEDQLDEDPTKLLNDPFWFDVAREPFVAAPKTGLSRSATEMHDELAVVDEVEKEAPPRPANGLPDVPGPHPLREHIIAQNALDAGRNLIDDTGLRNPMAMPHGTHGWVVVFDLSSRTSFEEASQIVEQLLDRAGFDPHSKQPCPIAILLVGNKADTSSGNRSAAPQKEVNELLLKGVMSGTMLSQLRKQKVVAPLRHLCDVFLREYKTKERASAGSLALSGGHEGDLVAERVSQQTGVSFEEYTAVGRLRAALESVRSSSSACSDLDVLGAVGALLRAPSGAAAGMPADEIAERWCACPGLSVKYVEVSCKTNHRIRFLERVLSRALGAIPTGDISLARGHGHADARRTNANANADGVLASIGAFFSGLDCAGARTK